MNSDNFSTHIIFDELNSIQEFFNREDFIENIPLEDTLYFKSAVSFITQRINLIIPELIQDSDLSGIIDEAHAAINHIKNFLNNKNINYLNQAKNSIKNSVNKSRVLPLIVENSDFDFSVKASNFSSTIKEEYQRIKKISDMSTSKLNEIEDNLKEENRKINELSNSIESKKLEIRDLNEKFKLEFNKITEQNTSEFDSNLTNYKNEFYSIKHGFIEEMASLKNGLVSSASEIINDLESIKKEARELIGLIGDTAVTGNYQKIANDHRENANFWRYTAAFFMILFSGVLIYTIWDLNSENLEWHKALIRIIAAVSLSYPATYAARESSKHRNLENINRKAELELAAINPFIELLPDDKKQAIKEKLVEKYFGNDVNLNTSTDEDMSIASFERILNAISNLKNK